MADVGSIRFAILMLILARTVLSRLLEPRVRGVLGDEGHFRPYTRGSGWSLGPSNEINELTLTKP
jgi:hypothetical protein